MKMSKMEKLEALHFSKIVSKTVWGKETILLSSREESMSIVDMKDSAFYGMSLKSLVDEYGPRLLGNSASSMQSFPMMAKLLHADSSLSLQVHPSMPDESGSEAKTEMWMSIGKSKAFIGLKDGTSRFDFLNGALGPNVQKYLQDVELEDREMALIEAGRVHALVEGDVLEVSQNSSTTYRLYDWGREGRKMSVDKGIDAIDFSLKDVALSRSRVSCPFFKCTYCPNGLEVASSKDTFTFVYLLDSSDGMLVPADIGNSIVKVNEPCLAVTV